MGDLNQLRNAPDIVRGVLLYQSVAQVGKA